MICKNNYAYSSLFLKSNQKTGVKNSFQAYLLPPRVTRIDGIYKYACTPVKKNM